MGEGMNSHCTHHFPGGMFAAAEELARIRLEFCRAPHRTEARSSPYGVDSRESIPPERKEYCGTSPRREQMSVRWEAGAAEPQKEAATMVQNGVRRCRVK